MGYQSDWIFDLRIPAHKVEEAEKVLYELMKHSDDSYNRGILEHVSPFNFCEAFNELWGEYLAEEEEATPLVAIASGSIRGDIVITDYCDKSWRDWEEPLLDKLAPFFVVGGTIEVKGEDYECSSIWEVDDGPLGKGLTAHHREPVCSNELRVLKRKAKKLEVAEALLTEHLRLADVVGNGVARGELNRKIKEYFKKPPALEQLAEQAE